MANILFLGGPRDGEHHEVTESAGGLPHTLFVAPAAEEYTVPALDAWPHFGAVFDPTLYQLRSQPGGAPAYIAPGWPPAPKACVVPDCTTQPRCVFTAAERGRLAGREWQRGDEIDLCPPHALDVYRAQYVYGVDQLAEWLRRDARPDLLDVAGIGSGLGAEEYAASAARALRVRP